VIERLFGRSTPAPVVGRGDVMEKIAWLVLGVVVLVAALRADRSARARRVGEVAFAALFIGAGALVNT
jgi:threonine/homoserine/homoserine lactone efflux protein